MLHRKIAARSIRVFAIECSLADISTLLIATKTHQLATLRPTADPDANMIAARGVA
jgi:hypothetical protein